MAKSIIFTKHGGPEVLKLVESKINTVGPTEVRIKNIAIGLNFIDTYHRSGLYPVKLPSGLGMEGAGVIEEIGSEVKNFRKGDNVAYAAPPLGSYSDERVVPENILVKIPDGITHKIAASIMTKGLTTYYLLCKTYEPKSGEKILFHAAAGGVGQIFCQWAKTLDCKIIGTVGSDSKIEIAKKNGCDFVINYKKDNFDEKVLEITNNKGVDVVYDGVGKYTFEKSLNSLKPRGMMVSFGNASGALVPIDVPKLLQPKGLFFVRPSMGQYLGSREELNTAANSLFEKIKYGKIKIEIFKEYPLSDARKAHQDLEERKILGSALLVPNE